MSPFTEFKLIEELQQKGGKIVLLVMDGLGGLPLTPAGKGAKRNGSARSRTAAR